MPNKCVVYVIPASEKIQNMFFLNVQDSNHFARMADDKL